MLQHATGCEREELAMAAQHTATPCIRHGVADTHDPDLSAILDELHRERPASVDAIGSLYLLEGGEVWATWHDGGDRSMFAPVLTDICSRFGHQSRHLVPVDLDYDYQEDVPPIS
jgi:hypothetical protein